MVLMAILWGVSAREVLAESAPARPSIKASALYMVDLKSGRVLLEKDATRRLPPASLTKVMTALVALESASPQQVVKIDRRALLHRSSLKLHAGEQFLLRDLLTAMLKVASTPQIDGVLASNDAMAFGAVEAFKELKKKMPLIVSINASKEAVDLIKAGDMLASGDYNGLVEGCLGAEIAIRTLHKQPVPKDVMAKTAVVDKTNYQAYEIPAERRPCPTLESMAAK